ncbi:MAG TPA: hypothetical protein VGR76_21490 [Candidatus Angelobacter sp.]|jgi:hypothetical protein|nr:hypothetical protein [Candidatus Angelobacter sp.]
MRTERNQLASVGRLHIWSLSDALPEKEVFQSALIHRDGVTKPILAETLNRSISQQLYLPMSGDESSCGMVYAVRKSLVNKCKSLHIVTGVTGKLRAGYYCHF